MSSARTKDTLRKYLNLKGGGGDDGGDDNDKSGKSSKKSASNKKESNELSTKRRGRLSNAIAGHKDGGVVESKQEPAKTEPAKPGIGHMDAEEVLSSYGSHSVEMIVKDITVLVANGHLFKAYSTARALHEKHPHNIFVNEIYSLTLLKTGSVSESKAVMLDMLSVRPEEEITSDFIRSNTVIMKSPADFLFRVGNIFKETWKFTKDCKDLEISKEFYLLSFEKNKDIHSGIEAAWLLWAVGEDEQAVAIAEEVLQMLPQIGLKASFEQLTILGEAQILLKREEDACRIFEEAMRKVEKKEFLKIVEVRQKLFLLREIGLRVPEKVFDVLKAPAVVVFSGQMIDKPGKQISVFTNEMEDSVREVISRYVEKLDALIAYSSASCGSEIIFLEEVLKRGGEINIVLPFLNQDFMENNVGYAGPRWEKRFEKLLTKAKTVTYAADDRYLGHDMLYRFCNQIMHGAAAIRSNFLTTRPHLLVLWESREEYQAGGPSDFIDQWTDIETLHLIDFDEVREKPLPDDLIIKNPPKENFVYNTYTEMPSERMIKCMMFSDLSGYSKLQDEHIPAFLDFLQKLNFYIQKTNLPIESINTWGDAVFAVASDPITIANFGLFYCDIVNQLGLKYPEFPMPIKARISLHCGPVYKAVDPFIKKENFYGGHINRAARLEPVTKVGQVFATQQFVSILSAEINKLKSECSQQGINYQEKFATEYVGVISLAKNFGHQEVYHLRKL